MTQYHGKGAYFGVDDSGGTLRDLSAHITSVQLQTSKATAGSTTYGDDWMESLGGHSSATIQITGVWDDTTTDGPDVVLSGIVADAHPGPVSIEFGPSGNGSGQVVYTCEAHCTAYSPSSPLEDVVGFTASFTVTGAITRTVNV